MSEGKSGVVVRLAELADAEVIAGFNREMAKETEDKSLDHQILSAGVRTLLLNPHLGFYCVAEKDGEIVGCLMVTSEWSDWRDGTFWWIQSVYVRPEHRRQGVYRRLYHFVKKKAREDPTVCGLRLYVERGNMAAQRTYQALGMRETSYLVYEEMLPRQRRRRR
ncbi:MAG: GNAT family N-acetyltransferase [Kiritimatiellae bacterium]|nr:GNAT family N-acetyltransferase [Kiritimatiellia bacterium]